MRRDVRQPEIGKAALAGAEHFAGAPETQVLFGDPESVVGPAQDQDARPRRGAQRGGVEQQASARPVPPADAPAQLMELGQAEPLRMFDDHDGRLGNVDADLDHGGRHEHRYLAGGEPVHPRVLLGALHAAVQQGDAVTQTPGERGMALLGRGDVDDVRLLHERAYPVDPVAAGDGPAHRLDDLVETVERHGARVHGRPARRLFVQPRNVHVAIRGHGECSGNRRRRHDEKIGAGAGGLGRQGEALVDAEPVLLVDHREREIAEGDAFLEDRVGADEYVDLARPQVGEGPPAGLALFPPRQKNQADAEPVAERREHVAVLPGQNLGRRHERRLGPAFDGVEHGKKGDDRLPRPHVALQQPQHTGGGGHVVAYLLQRPLLGSGQGIGEGLEGARPQRAVPGDAASRARADALADEGEGDLVGQKLVVGQPFPRRTVGLQAIRRLRGVRGQERVLPPRPSALREEPGLQPFGRVGRLVERRPDGAPQRPRGQSRGQRVDGLHGLEGLDLLDGPDAVGVGDLDLVPVALDAAAHHALLADGQHALQVIRPGVKEDQGQRGAVVAAQDLVRQALVGGRQVTFDDHGQRHDCAFGSVRHRGRVAAVDDLDRQMPVQVHEPGAGDLLDQFRDTGPDARQAGDGREGGEQDFRAHDGLVRARTTAIRAKSGDLIAGAERLSYRPLGPSRDARRS